MRSAMATSCVVGEKHRAHRHRLQRLLGHLPQHRRRVEPNLGALASAASDAPPGVPSCPSTSCSGVARSV